MHGIVGWMLEPSRDVIHVANMREYSAVPGSRFMAAAWGIKTSYR